VARKKQDSPLLLKKLRDLDPKSDLSRAAAAYLKMLSPTHKKGGGAS
jgi:hypothetical protein